MTARSNRTPTPDQLEALGLKALAPVGRVMVRQILFMDPPERARVRALPAKCFNPRRVAPLREHVADIIGQLLDRVQTRGVTNLIADLGLPLPATVSSEMLVLPSEDWPQLASWTPPFAALLGNFRHNPVRAVRAVDDMTAYVRNAIHTQSRHSEDGPLYALVTAETAGHQFTEGRGPLRESDRAHRPPRPRRRRVRGPKDPQASSCDRRAQGANRMGSAPLTEPVRWRRNAGAFRGLKSLPIEF